MKKINLLFTLLLFAIGSYSQVGINTKTPNASAALDINSTEKGILIPRMTTVQKLAISNPAEGLLVYDTNQKQIYQNIGTPTAPNWVTIGYTVQSNKFFYMPAFKIDVTTKATGKTIDLYTEYKNQFTGSVNAQFVSSTGAPKGVSATPAGSGIPYFANASQLYYYITKYDDNVISNVSIDANGIMTYDIIEKSTYKSFMNVVFVIK